MYVCMHACIYVCMYVCMYAHVRIYTRQKKNLHGTQRRDGYKRLYSLYARTCGSTFILSIKNTILNQKYSKCPFVFILVLVDYTGQMPLQSLRMSLSHQFINIDSKKMSPLILSLAHVLILNKPPQQQSKRACSS